MVLSYIYILYIYNNISCIHDSMYNVGVSMVYLWYEYCLIYIYMWLILVQ